MSIRANFENSMATGPVPARRSRPSRNGWRMALLLMTAAGLSGATFLLPRGDVLAGAAGILVTLPTLVWWLREKGRQTASLPVPHLPAAWGMSVFAGCVPWVGLPYREGWLLGLYGMCAVGVLAVFAMATKSWLPAVCTLVVAIAVTAASVFVR